MLSSIGKRGGDIRDTCGQVNRRHKRQSSPRRYRTVETRCFTAVEMTEVATIAVASKENRPRSTRRKKRGSPHHSPEPGRPGTGNVVVPSRISGTDSP